jgi:Holliday junction resolvase
MKARKKRGYDAERELVLMLRKEDFKSLRVPVSAPSKEPFPDVFAVRGDVILAFEVKSMERYAYYKEDQIVKLFGFLEIHKIYPRKYAVLAAKFKYKGWVFYIAEKPGNYTLKVGTGISLSKLLKQIESNTTF